MRTIVLNQTNIVPNTNNSTLVYKFPSSVSFNNSKIAIASINIYYSWVNISSTLQNNSLSFNWVNQANTNNYTTYTIFIPSGLYEVTDINAYLQFIFINAPNLNTSQINPVPTAPFYLKDSIGDNVYFLEFVVNPTKYSIQLNTYNVPSTLPTNFSNPGNTLLPAATFNPIVAMVSEFSSTIGYSSTFASAQNQNNATANPSTETAYKIGSTFSYLSTTVPSIQPNSNLLVSLSNIDNAYANPSSIIYCLTPSVSIGELIVEKPPQLIFSKLLSGITNELRLQFLGTDLNNVAIQDPQMTILLVIEDN